MSLHIGFEPHSWYRGFAIKDERKIVSVNVPAWYAVTANGMTGYLVEFEDTTLRNLKRQITDYRHITNV